MPTLRGLNITVSIYRRAQQNDDDVGGSVQIKQLIYSRIPGCITQLPTPMQLKAQGIENLDNFDCVLQPIKYDPLSNLEFDDIVVPESGQYQGKEFVVTNIYDNPLADDPIDYRFIHKRLSLRRITKARQIL